MLFVYNCNPAGDDAGSEPRPARGSKREDLFTVVFEQVMTDTARYADVVLPATTFLEDYDIAKGYGPITPAARAAGDRAASARRAPNADVFSELAQRASASASAEEETETLAAGARAALPAQRRRRAAGDAASATPPFGGAPIQFVDVFPLTPDRKVDLFPDGARRDGARRAVRLPARSRRPSASRSR